VAGLVGDWIAQSLPWGFTFADLKMPVVVWHGELDHLVRPAHAHYLSAVLPNSRLMLYPRTGICCCCSTGRTFLPRSPQEP
jgi:pimeloyl-ACP methyl ester carboxylesterase